MRQTSCLFCLDAAALLMVNEQQTVLLVWSNQTSQTGGQLYSDTTPYGECCLVYANMQLYCVLYRNILIRYR